MRIGSRAAAFVILFIVPASSIHPRAIIQQHGGTVTGKIEIPPVVQSAQREGSSRYRTSSAGTSPTSSVEMRPEVTNVVVYLEGAGLDKVQRESRKAVLDQLDATFTPHVLPIVKGTTVRVVNRDKTYHNVFSLSNLKKFNIGRRPTGEEVPVTFDKAGTVQVFCDIHSHMSAFILVLENPMFVQPKADGTFELNDVPPGRYTIQAWHERFSASPQPVSVKAGETSTVNFNLQ